MNPARLVLPPLRWRAEGGFAHETGTISTGLRLGVGGFIIFGGTVEEVSALTTELGQRAGRGLLVAADLERGAGQQVRGLTEIPPPGALATLDDAETVATAAGALTAAEAREVGINWVLAPVADLDIEPANPIVQSRSFGEDPAPVAGLVAAWVRGCQGNGALACVKHYPGHGRTRTDSHAGLPVVDAPAAALHQADLTPFMAALRAQVGGVMSAHVAYPALDPSGLPATMSPAILGELRHAHGFDGLIVTDAMNMAGATREGGPGAAAVAAIRAGCDILLYPGDQEETVEALNRALASGDLDERLVWSAVQRIERTVDRIARMAPPLPGNAELPRAWADQLVERGVVRGPLPSLRGDLPLGLDIVDDDIGGPFPPGPSDWVSRSLAGRGASLGEGGDRVLLAFAEPRGWKGRPGFSPSSLARLAELAPESRLIVLFGHPRLVDELPGDVPVLVAWHRQRLMQEAVARRLEQLRA